MIALDEELATAYPGEPPLGPPPFYPDFGDSKSLYDEERDQQPPIKRFYAAWLSFGSRKSFSSFDQYRTTEAPDRRIKR
jgi:DnaJ family protein A protein 5